MNDKTPMTNERRAILAALGLTKVHKGGCGYDNYVPFHW